MAFVSAWSAVLAATVAWAGVGDAGGPRVAASPLIAPCAVAAVAQAGNRTDVLVAEYAVAAGAADVFVGAAAEVTRAIESGLAVEGSDVDVLGVPWVLAGASGTTLDEIAASGVEIAVPSSGAAAAGRRAAERLPGARVRPVATDRLAAAPLALVPAPLAAGRPSVRADLEPLSMRAVVLEGSADPAAATAWLRLLAAAGRQPPVPCRVPEREP